MKVKNQRETPQKSHSNSHNKYLLIIPNQVSGIQVLDTSTNTPIPLPLLHHEQRKQTSPLGAIQCRLVFIPTRLLLQSKSQQCKPILININATNKPRRSPILPKHQLPIRLVVSGNTFHFYHLFFLPATGRTYNGKHEYHEPRRQHVRIR